MAPGDFIITPSWTWHDHGNRAASRWCGWTASTSASSSCSPRSSTRSIRKRCSRCRAARARRPRATATTSCRWRPRRRSARPRHLQLSVRAQPRFARQALAGPGSRSLSRLEDAVHEPAHRRARDADPLPRSSSCCRRGSARRPIARPTARSTASSKAKGACASAMKLSTTRRATLSWLPPGRRCASRRRARRRCSRFPIARTGSHGAVEGKRG